MCYKLYKNGTAYCLAWVFTQLDVVNTMITATLYPKMQLKEPVLIHRPEEVLDIQSEFINGMVHLPQECNFGTPTTLPSPATPPLPLTVTLKAIFPLT